MLVYRIEDGEGRGPFTTGKSIAYTVGHKCHDGHSAGDPPNPSNDYHGGDLAERFCAGVHYCGFKSKAQLRRWFRSQAGRRALKKEGFHVSVFDIPKKEVLKGHWQIAFRRPAFDVVGKLDLETLKQV